MSEQSAVGQAIALLVDHLRNARERRNTLTAEIKAIEDALTSLGVSPDQATVKDATSASEDETLSGATVAPRTTAYGSVRASVKTILESEPRAFTPAEIRERVPAEIMNGRSAQQRTNSVRTALWSLRQKGEARLVDDSRTIATKWPQPDGPSDPNGPTEVRPFELTSPPPATEVKSG